MHINQKDKTKLLTFTEGRRAKDDKDAYKLKSNNEELN